VAARAVPAMVNYRRNQAGERSPDPTQAVPRRISTTKPMSEPRITADQVIVVLTTGDPRNGQTPRSHNFGEMKASLLRPKFLCFRHRRLRQVPALARTCAWPQTQERDPTRMKGNRRVKRPGKARFPTHREEARSV